MIPGEFTEAIRTITGAFGEQSGVKPRAATQPTTDADADEGEGEDEDETPQIEHDGPRQIGHGGLSGSIEALDATSAADQVVKSAEAAVSEAKAEAQAAESARGVHGVPRD